MRMLDTLVRSLAEKFPDAYVLVSLRQASQSLTQANHSSPNELPEALEKAAEKISDAYKVSPAGAVNIAMQALHSETANVREMGLNTLMDFALSPQNHAPTFAQLVSIATVTMDHVEKNSPLIEKMRRALNSSALRELVGADNETAQEIALDAGRLTLTKEFSAIGEQIRTRSGINVSGSASRTGFTKKPSYA